MADAPKDAQVPAPDYTKDELEYRARHLNEMVTARNVRETPHDEFDGMTYIQRCESNRKLANTFIAPKKNREDSNYQGGTVRQKLNTYLSHLTNLSIEAEVRAFDDQSIEDVELGTALTDIVSDSNIRSRDDEKKLARQYVMFEQGEVFVEEVWEEVSEVVKDFEKGVQFDGSNFDKVSWTTKTKFKNKGPTRRIILNENVYLGDITVFDMDRQPFIFTVEQVSYSEAEARFTGWKRWVNVPKTVKYLDQPIVSSVYNQNFSITEVQKSSCEIVTYQNIYLNEYAIYVNGVLMTPVGLPIPRRWGDDGETVRYNVEKQVFGLISPFFAYGKGIPATLKTKAFVLDEMNRLAVLKTQGSFQPARWNLTGQVLSSRVFMPGKVANGLDGSKIGTLSDPNGMTRSELQMIQYIQKGIDDDFAAATFLQGQGIGTGGRVSATQITAAKNMAELMLVLSVFSATMLEIKLGNLRLYNLLENFFEPLDQRLNKAKDGLENKYRSITVDKVLPGFGPGQSVVEVNDQQLSPRDIADKRSAIERRTGKPTELRIINPKTLKLLSRSFFVTALAKPKKNSDLTRVLFNEMFQNARNFPNLNFDYLSERFAVVWGEDPTKMFNKGQGAQPNQPDQQGAGSPQPGGSRAAGQNGARGKMVNKQMMKAGQGPRPTVTATENQ